MKSLIYRLLYKLSFLLLFACDKSADVPNGILSQNQMVDILIRIHLSEAKSSNSMLIGDTSRFYYKSLEDSIFIKNKLSKQQYIESYTYCMKNIGLMDNIYSRVIDSLSLREALKNINY